MLKRLREVVCNILSYLDGDQRLTAGLVCKRWLKASDTVYQDVCLFVTGQPSPLMHTPSRRFPHIKFHGTVIDDDCVDLLNHIGPHLLHLKLKQCQVRSRRKVVNCLNLRSLALDEADNCLIFASLPSLESLCLNYADDLTDEILVAFDRAVSTNLSVFVMPTCMVDEHLVCMRYYPHNRTCERDPSEYIVSFTAIESFMRKRAKTLTTLVLPMKIDPVAAVRLSKMEGLALRTVYFALCRYCNDCVPEFCESQPHVVNLNVTDLCSMDDEDVVDICGRLPALRTFLAARCVLLNTSVVPLFGMQHLRELCLGSCTGIKPDSFEKAVSSLALPKLYALDLSDTKIPDSCIRELLPRVPRLVHLNLSGCSVSDGTLVAVSRQMTHLRKLSLRGCIGLSDEGLSGRCEESGVALCNLTKLTHLDLCACAGFTQGEIVKVVRFQHLKFLNLTRCPNITSFCVTELMANNRCLTKLQWDRMGSGSPRVARLGRLDRFANYEGRQNQILNGLLKY